MSWQMTLSENRERQLKLRQELWDASITPGYELNLSAVLKLSYLYYVIRKRLRRDPLTPFSSRRHVKAGQNVVVDGYTISAGVSSSLHSTRAIVDITRAIVSAQPYSMHRNSKAVPNAEEWIPERWVIQTKEPYPVKCLDICGHSHSGQRMCVSMHIAWAVLRLVVARLYSTYDLSLGDAYLGPDKKILPDADRQHLFPYTAQELLRVERLSIAG
ncbi:cytochrome P450 [Cadophora sp. MPI-SDFR-AT-0126]|nr:cytochrome P450 [Leotiomycetes sp. MPI-SDFR-AT-0126]